MALMCRQNSDVGRDMALPKSPFHVNLYVNFQSKCVGVVNRSVGEEEG